MPYKRPPTDDEIAVLIEELKPLIKEGEAVWTWLRKHKPLLQKKVVDGMTWQGIAVALTQLGMTYKTGKPWTARSLLKQVAGCKLEPKPTVVVTSMPPAPPQLDPVSQGPRPAPEPRPKPRFVPATFRTDTPSTVPTQEDLERHARARERFFGKKTL